MNDIVNPLSPAPPTFDVPAGMEISSAAREFAQAPVSAWQNGVLASRPPDDREQIARLAQARDVLGDRFWQTAGPPAPTAAEKAAMDQAQMLGVHTRAEPADFAIAGLPPESPPDTADRIRGFMGGLEFTSPYAAAIANRLVAAGRETHRMNESEIQAWSTKQQRQIDDWAAHRGWDLPAVKANVSKMLEGRDAAISALAMHDFEAFVRLAMHAENLKAVKKG